MENHPPAPGAWESCSLCDAEQLADTVLPDFTTSDFTAVAQGIVGLWHGSPTQRLVTWIASPSRGDSRTFCCSSSLRGHQALPWEQLPLPASVFPASLWQCAGHVNKY